MGATGRTPSDLTKKPCKGRQSSTDFLLHARKRPKGLRSQTTRRSSRPPAGPPPELQLHSSRVAETLLSNILLTRGGIWRVSLDFSLLQKKMKPSFFLPIIILFFLRSLFSLIPVTHSRLGDDTAKVDLSGKTDWD